MKVNCNAPVIGNPGACDSRSIVGLNCHDLTSIVPAVPWNNSGFDEAIPPPPFRYAGFRPF